MPRKIYTILLLLSLLCCARCFAKSTSIYLLQTTDIHAVLTKEEPDSGSWLKLASIISETRNNYGAGNCILVDCGDTIQGTLIGAISKGAAATIPLKTLAYDAWIPGNHEFDFGFPRFLELTEPLRNIILCGNLIPLQAAPFPAWKMFHRDGARIALIGMTASYLKFWFGEAFGDACQIEFAATSLKRIFPEILPLHPDLIVLAIHQAWMETKDARNVNEVADLVQQFPEIDLVLGGHTHRSLPGHKIGPRTWYVQAGHAAKSLGVVRAILDTEKHEVTQITSCLMNIQEDTPDCPELRKDLALWLDKAEQAKTQAIAPAPSNDILSKGRPGINCQASDLFCAALAEATGTSIALHGTLSNKNFSAGKPVTAQDLFDFVPYENTIVTASLTPAELAEIVLEQWQNRDSYTYSGIWGIQVRINPLGNQAEIPARPDQKDPPDKDLRLQIALNSFT
ncbi:MAG: metallophosphoesterase, partial [Lentisphaeria bacterium]